jgi:tetraacyldisaccharide 4'-kinase
MNFADVQRAIAAGLERGVDRAPARWASRAWRRLADPVRPVELPRSARVIGVGGATLGGSGKTPVVAALALALSERVAVLATAYRARAGRPALVRVGDDPRNVGDEALALARALAPRGICVVCGRERHAALAFAANIAPIVIADGLLQSRPRRLALSVLVLDASAPWGSGACPPAGDLRADAARLLDACDVILLGAGSGGASWQLRDDGRVLAYRDQLLGARTPGGELIGVDALASLRLGVTLAIARPQRVVRELEAHGIHPRAIRFAADHGQPTGGGARGLDAWLTTDKCGTKLGDSLVGVPVWVLERRLELPAALVERVRGNQHCSWSMSQRLRDKPPA